MIITEDKLQAAIKGMVETDDTCATAKVEVGRKDFLCRIAKSKIFLNSEGNIEQRKAKAEISPEVFSAQEEYFTAMGEYEKLKAKRETNAFVIEIWRSENANRRQGNI